MKILYILIIITLALLINSDFLQARKYAYDSDKVKGWNFEKVRLIKESSSIKSHPTDDLTESLKLPKEVLSIHKSMYKVKSIENAQEANKDSSKKKTKQNKEIKKIDEDTDADEFSIYPNMSSTYIRISNHTEEKTQIISLYNTSGEQVFQESFSGKTTNIDVSRIPSGIYLLFLNNKVPKRIIIAH